MNDKVKYMTDRESEIEALALSIINRQHWTKYRLAEIADWKGGYTALAKRLLRKYRMSY